MAFDRARTSLQQVEERLRKLFNLAGNIGATFEPDIRPVILAGDLDGPGYASFRGRHFAVMSPAMGPNATANDVYAILFPVNFVAYSLHLTGLAPNSVVSCFALEPEAPGLSGVVINTATGTWIDQRSQTADPTPFTDTGGRTANATLTGLCVSTRRVASWAANNNGSGSERDVVLQGGGGMFPAGTVLCWTLAGAQATVGFNIVHAGLHGRIF